MAVLDFTRATTGSFGLVGRIGATLVNTVVEWNDARSTRNALNELSDRELDDIGMCRGDIDLVAEGRR